MESLLIVLLFIKFLFVYLILDTKAEVNTTICTNWALSGGYEGVISVFYNGTRVNICADSSNTSIYNELCLKIFPNANTVKIAQRNYSTNVYGAKLENRTISYNLCHDPATKVSLNGQTCKPLSLCCVENHAQETCSVSWGKTLSSHFRLESHNEHHLRYNELIGANFTGKKTGKKEWIRSALIDGSCVASNLTENNCLKRCRVTKNLTFLLFTKENKTCCTEQRIDQYANDTEGSVCHIRELNVSTPGYEKYDWTDWGIRYCLAAEVIDDTPFIYMVDCELLLPPLIISEDSLPTTTSELTTELSPITNHKRIPTASSTQSSASFSSSADEPEAISKMYIIVGGIVGFLILMFILLTSIVLWKFKQKSRLRETQRPNSVINRAYTIEDHVHNNDEEYTLISDMEVEAWSSECYKPPVPDRSESKYSKNSDRSEVEIVTLDDYSTPSDHLKVRYKISQTDYCTTTYDDPIRLKLKDAAESVSKVDSEEVKCSSDKKEDPCLNLDKDRYENNPPQETNSDIKQARTSAYEDSVGALVIFDSSDSKVAKSKAHESQVEHNAENSHLGINKHGELTYTGEHCTSCDCASDDGFSSSDSLQKGDNGGSDYEDSGTMDCSFKAGCATKHVLEEHICLDCLKPEHLKRLGIKLISEEMYEKHNEIQRSKSEPSSQTFYYNIGEINVTTDITNNAYETSSKEVDDSLTDLKVLRRKKRSGNARRCSVCNTVYDRLGSTHKNAWANITDNVYDKFGDIKHFKHRQQVSGKRINST